MLSVMKVQFVIVKNVQNHCMLTVSSFNDGSEHISGNRCERGANLPPKSKQLPNLYDYKYRRVSIIVH